MVQRGGTATILQGLLSKYVKKAGKNRGTDHTNLGRWSWYTLEGESGHRTKIITAYAPVGNERSSTGSNWKHQQRYIQKNNLLTTVFEMFCDDLCTLLQDWQSQNDRIILLMDANNNVHNGTLSKRLAGDLIQMKEAVHKVKRGQGPNTHIRGSEPFDGIWHTPELLL